MSPDLRTPLAGIRAMAETLEDGLGLAIARGIVEAHQGDISVRNEGGRLPLRFAASTGQTVY